MGRIIVHIQMDVTGISYSHIKALSFIQTNLPRDMSQDFVKLAPESSSDADQASWDCANPSAPVGYTPVSMSSTQELENESGFKHGMIDAFRTNNNETTYISQPGHGMGHHTQVFNDRYQKGWCSVMGGSSGIEEPYTEFDCVDQP